MEWRRAAGPVAHGDEIRAVHLGDGEERLPVEDADAGRLMGEAGQSLQFRRGDPAQVQSVEDLRRLCTEILTAA